MLAPTGESGHVMTSLVGVYVAARQLEDAHKVFDEMLTRAVSAWNCMLAAYV
jgi:pentatricopeptide repeat protein